MTTSEKNAKLQKQIHIEVEKQAARMLALQTATTLKPPTPYVSGLTGNVPHTPKYDVIAEAEKIYQWLIKDLK